MNHHDIMVTYMHPCELFTLTYVNIYICTVALPAGLAARLPPPLTDPASNRSQPGVLQLPIQISLINELKVTRASGAPSCSPLAAVLCCLYFPFESDSDGLQPRATKLRMQTVRHHDRQGGL